ncbi:hypothetical protein CHARACLAT_018470 [Characodon lateralis]|uniref:Uncharacterized protein n=1 Tax=Characodon lateralis TaxID=208331 RepID=A0ABU7EAQ9_9TELE|nr:hypothetical protein [Characodon lateralis]
MVVMWQNAKNVTDFNALERHCSWLSQLREYNTSMYCTIHLAYFESVFFLCFRSSLNSVGSRSVSVHKVWQGSGFGVGSVEHSPAVSETMSLYLLAAAWMNGDRRMDEKNKQFP